MNFISNSDIDKVLAGDVKALTAAFHWDKTREGSSYWSSVSLLGEIDEEVIAKLRRIRRQGF